MGNTLTQIPAQVRSVTISENGESISITETLDGDITITGLGQDLSPAQQEILANALSYWKWGLEPCA